MNSTDQNILWQHAERSKFHFTQQKGRYTVRLNVPKDKHLGHALGKGYVSWEHFVLNRVECLTAKQEQSDEQNCLKH